MSSPISPSYVARASALVPWFSPAFLTDYALLILAYFGTSYLYHLHPFKRDVAHYLFNSDVSYPHLIDQVSVDLLNTLTLSLPLAIIVLVALSRWSLHDLHHGIMSLSVSRTIMKLIVECAKNRVGRLRPDFLARCAYDVVEGVCTGKESLVRDGRKSFPSGHSGAAFQGLVLLSLFLAGKNGESRVSLGGKNETDGRYDRCVRFWSDDAGWRSTSIQDVETWNRSLSPLPRGLDRHHVHSPSFYPLHSFILT